MNNWQLSQCNGDPTCEAKYSKPRDRQLLCGASAGGPARIPKIYDSRNRTFSYGAFEQYEQQQLQLSQDYAQTVPIPDFLNGNFSQLLTNTVAGTDALGRMVYVGQIFDPATLMQVNGKWVSDPFPGNIIPSNRVSAVSYKVIDIYRKECQPMIAGRLTNNSALTLHNASWFHQTQLTFKGDHQISL